MYFHNKLLIQIFSCLHLDFPDVSESCYTYFAVQMFQILGPDIQILQVFHVTMCHILDPEFLSPGTEVSVWIQMFQIT